MKPFKEALEASEPSVDLVIKHLIESGCTEVRKNHDKRYDISYLNTKGEPRTIEVKNDLEYSKTGNVAIEFESRGKPSGICSSVADIWYYVLENKLYWAPRPDILRYLIKNWDRFRRVNAGDKKGGVGTSLCCLLKFEDFLDVFYPIEWG